MLDCFDINNKIKNVVNYVYMKSFLKVNNILYQNN